MADLDVPYTLVHGDLHLANTARIDGVLTFFDWTDACVAHPFVDLMALKFETDDNEKQSIMDAYLAGWNEVATPGALSASNRYRRRIPSGRWSKRSGNRFGSIRARRG